VSELAIDGVMIALANYLASAPLNLARTGPSIAMWAMEADSARAADTWSVVRPHGGQASQVPVPDLAVQVYTVSKAGTGPAIVRAQALHSRLTDTIGRPLRDFAMGAFAIKGIRRLTLPGKIGVNEQGRPEVVFNFDLSFIPAD
jgi:hypothetical protein